MNQSKIVMLGGNGTSTKIVYNYLQDNFGIDKLIISDGEPRSNIIKKRIKRLGYLKTLGQILFSLFIKPLLKNESKNRYNNIIKNNNLNLELENKENIIYSDSVNSKKVINILKEINPDLIIVNGTSIISEEVLNCVPANFINMHAGITPMYRGSHGAYWAICNNDYDNAGVTIHYVDAGIDTGKIICQKKIKITSEDNFITYPLLQTVEGLKMYEHIIEKELSGKLKDTKVENTKKYKLYYGPSIFQYIYNRIVKKCK